MAGSRCRSDTADYTGFRTARQPAKLGVDRTALAGRFGVGKKQVKLADTATVLRLIGYPVGGVPPFGHVTRVPVLLDVAVQHWAAIYGGGGDDHTLLHVAPAELARVTEAEWVDL